jgi:ABC-2 type transport system ATP-binding protein
MIKAVALTKDYFGISVLKSVSFDVARGEVFCLLGSQGAGKTTIIQLFLGFQQPTEGSALLGGLDVAQHSLETKKLLTYLPSRAPLYPNLTGIENLAHFVRLAGHTGYPNSRLIDFLVQAGIAPDTTNQRVADYTQIERQKVGLALAYAKASPILLLDESIAGCSEEEQQDFASRVRALAQQGVAVLAATRHLDHACDMATHIGILQDGTLHTTLSPEEASATLGATLPFSAER